ncbi:hypothetical protein Glove_213g81 [Diversispora epigaea]|uniref:Uncharacterized protein n=1 Tax=Diversispora epigaea TaxID=1348612 RepID=A0A397II01_9GLOM|nr:hypothetical protein Glove_213g81 [Diversispora epigaea]
MIKSAKQIIGSLDEISEKTKKELIDCTDKYVVDNVTKKVIVEKKKTEVIATITSTQMKDDSFEINEKITKELDVSFTSSNDICDPEIEKELLDASDKYVIDKATQEAIGNNRASRFGSFVDIEMNVEILMKDIFWLIMVDLISRGTERDTNRWTIS